MLSPAVVTVSNPGMRSVRVSWGPLQPESVKLYVVEYSALPQGRLRTTTITRDRNSTLLTQLQPDTQYLVTVSALHSSGQERAMSVKVCTQEGKQCCVFLTNYYMQIRSITVLHSAMAMIRRY